MYSNVIKKEDVMYNERIIRNAELLQILLLDNLYALSGSEYIMFQGGSATRWVHGGMRFSEDLDFVTHLPADTLDGLLVRLQTKARNACIAQFGPGKLEQKPTGKSADELKTFFIFRPEAGRERIAVKMNFKMLMTDQDPAMRKYILRDLPAINGIIAGGTLIMPYSSSIILAEIPVQILADRVRALYERKYIKGCDIYDIWWIHRKLGVNPSWDRTRETFALYRSAFIPVRKADYFQRTQSHKEIISALKTDLSQSIPPEVNDQYESQGFADFIESIRQVTQSLLDQGMRTYLEKHEGNKKVRKTLIPLKKKKLSTKSMKGTKKVRKDPTPSKKKKLSTKSMKRSKEVSKVLSPPKKKKLSTSSLKGSKKVSKALSSPKKKALRTKSMKGSKKISKTPTPPKKKKLRTR